LTRTFGDEKIRLTFTTADLNNNVPGEDMAEDGAFDDADMDVQSGGANTKGAINQGKTQDGNIRVAPEDRIAPADREELEEDYEDEGQQQGFPAHASIRIERPGKGALAIEATAQDGDFLIEDLYYFPSADLADPATAEKDWSRRTLYTGPPFNNLDEDLQILLEKYLEERGINTRLALFIPDYIDHKEQKEYIRWLNSTLYSELANTSDANTFCRRQELCRVISKVASSVLLHESSQAVLAVASRDVYISWWEPFTSNMTTNKRISVIPLCIFASPVPLSSSFPVFLVVYCTVTSLRLIPPELFVTRIWH
jgi:hypothetical protein